MKKALVLFWFVVCLLLFGIVLYPIAVQRALPSMKEQIQYLHDTLRPLFFRPSAL